MDTRFFLFADPLNLLIALAVVASLLIAARDVLSMRRQRQTSAKPVFGANALLYGSGFVILLGCLGYFLEMKTATCAQNVLPGSSFVTVVCTVTDSVERLRNLTDCYIKSASVMLTACAAALLLSLLWFAQSSYSHRK